MKPLRIRTIFAVDSPTSRNAILVIGMFGFVLLSFIWFGLYYKVQSEQQHTTAEAFKDTGNFARMFEEHTIRTLKNADQVTLFLKYEYEKAGQSLDITQYLREGRLDSRLFVLLSVINENGDLVVSSQNPFVPSNVKDREHFQVHQNTTGNQLFISTPVLGRSSGKWSIQFTRRVNKSNGDFGGIVVVSVDPSYFTEFYGQVDLGESSLITLVGRDGIVRARESEAKSDLGQDIRNSALLQHASESPVGRFVTTSEIDGIHRIHSYRALEAYPFIVSVGISEEEVFRELNERIAVYYWVAAVATSVITLFIIALLMVTARQRRTEEKLMKSRATLECEVEKRTQELLAANEELTAMNEEHVAMNEELQHTNQELHKEIVDRNKVENSLKLSKDELEQTNSELITALATIEQAQRQLIQQEKLAGIGQLAAGVAHEINNPLGYVTGNVETLEQYFASFEKVLACYRELQLALVNADNPQIREKASAAAKCEQAADLNYIQNDLPALFRDTIEGLDRMSKIVKGMRVFSRIDQHQVFGPYDLLDGLESTLLVAHNEIKHCASVVNNLCPIPTIEAVGSEINQVLLNLIVNAAQSIKSKKSAEAGLITLSTWHDDNYVYCSIEDNGIGIAPTNLTNLFNLFFTTKPVGHGTGMGLSISYDIIATRHNGDILAESIEGHGAKFTLKLPIRHSEPANENQ